MTQKRTRRHTTARRSGLRTGLGLLALTVVAALASPARAQAPAIPVAASDRGQVVDQSRWAPRPPLHQPRGGLAVATAGDRILAIAGFDPSLDAPFDVVEARSLDGAGAWRPVAPVSTARGNLGAAQVGGRVYAVGGFDAVGAVDVVEVYDLRSGRWSRGLPLPEPRGGVGVAALSGLLYVAGGDVTPPGSDVLTFTNSVLAYDPRRNAWTPVAPMTTKRERLDLVAAGPYLYAIGGDDEAGRSLTTVERYDPRTDTWRVMAPMVESRTLTCAVATTVGDRPVLVAVAGRELVPGGGPVNVRRTTEVYDLRTGRWTVLDVLLPFGRQSHDCVAQPDGTVLAIGGFTPSSVPGPPRVLADVDALSLEAFHANRT